MTPKYSHQFLIITRDLFIQKAEEDLRTILNLRNRIDCGDDDFFYSSYKEDLEREIKKIADGIRSYSTELRRFIDDSAENSMVWSFHPDVSDPAEGLKWHYAEFDFSSQKVFIREYNDCDDFC